MEKKLAYVDFCRTLTKNHTLRRFLEFVAAQSGTRLRLESLAILNRLSRGSTAKLAARFLRGMDEAVLDELGKRFVREILSSDLNTPVIDRVRRLHQEGYQIVLLSAALPEYLKHFREVLPIDQIISNEATYLGSRHSGRFKREYEVYGEGKVRAIREFEAKNQFGDVHRICISDHLSDLPMLQHGHIAIVVNPESPELIEKARSSAWEIME